MRFWMGGLIGAALTAQFSGAIAATSEQIMGVWGASAAKDEYSCTPKPGTSVALIDIAPGLEERVIVRSGRSADAMMPPVSYGVLAPPPGALATPELELQGSTPGRDIGVRIVETAPDGRANKLEWRMRGKGGAFVTSLWLLRCSS